MVTNAVKAEKNDNKLNQLLAIIFIWLKKYMLFSLKNVKAKKQKVIYWLTLWTR